MNHNCQEHLGRYTPIIISQRYCNHREHRVETLLDVIGDKCLTDLSAEPIHIDYFRDIYTLAQEDADGSQ